MPNATYTLQNAIELATFAHLHQKDKAGEPYINHPLRVLQSVQAQGAPAYAQIAAVLHDVTEDTPFTLDMLRAFGVPEAAVKIVALMDRHESERIFNSLWDAREETVFDYALKHAGNGMDPYRWYDKTYLFGGHEAGVVENDPTTYYYAAIKRNHAALLVKKADIGDNTQPWRLEYLEDATRERLRNKYNKALEMLGAL